MIKEEFCTGIIPLSRENDFWDVLIVRHKKGNYWGFPKGHCLKMEDPIKAAARELLEETNLKVIRLLDHPPMQEDYTFYRDGDHIHKTVQYYLAEVTRDFQVQKSEILEARFVKASDLLSFFSFPEGKKMVKGLLEILEN